MLGFFVCVFFFGVCFFSDVQGLSGIAVLWIRDFEADCHAVWGLEFIQSIETIWFLVFLWVLRMREREKNCVKIKKLQEIYKTE